MDTALAEFTTLDAAPLTDPLVTRASATFALDHQILTSECETAPYPISGEALDRGSGSRYVCYRMSPH